MRITFRRSGPATFSATFLDYVMPEIGLVLSCALVFEASQHDRAPFQCQSAFSPTQRWDYVLVPSRNRSKDYRRELGQGPFSRSKPNRIAFVSCDCDALARSESG